MKLLVITSAPIIYNDEKKFAYSPYVREMEIWQKYSSEIAFCCPVWEKDNGLLITEIPFHVSRHYKLEDFNITSVINLLKAIPFSLISFFTIVKAMHDADHIHLRCPGNVGLLGSIAQIFFPRKKKTVKYAGNWDPNSPQPISYKMQKWIVSNTFLSHNIKVLVYGEWPKMTNNIQPFFTATYSEKDKMPLMDKNLKNEINFVFVGTLVSGKNPIYALEIINGLYKKKYDVRLTMFGEGSERKAIEDYIRNNNLQSIVTLEGNQNTETVKSAYQQSHFVILPSQSEGWPKVIAEGMFWGCVPIATAVSCIPFMLDHGNRGILLQMNLENDIALLEKTLLNGNDFRLKSENAALWSRNFTTDIFESQIKQFLQV